MTKLRTIVAALSMLVVGTAYASECAILPPVLRSSLVLGSSSGNADLVLMVQSLQLATFRTRGREPGELCVLGPALEACGDATIDR